jgi:hypothetical protein
MSKKKSRKQKLYKMVGCSKKTRKNYLGGSTDTPLAYTGKPFFSVPNPNLAYTGKGGSFKSNTNSANPAYPNTGPVSNGNDTIFNNASQQRGGSCSLCSSGLMLGGSRHRTACKCSSCKRQRLSIRGGNQGVPYSNGLVGLGWDSQPSTWPGVDGISGDRNYYPQNNYNNDPQTAMKNVGANPPFLDMKAGKKRRQRGGTLSNFMGQDLINLGRQIQFGFGSAYNALTGYSSPVNPLPWKEQFPNSSSPINPALI